MEKPEKVTERMLQRVCEGMETRQIAAVFRMSLDELAAWAVERRTVRALRGLRLLADMQTQVILSRYRLTAAAKLVALANQKDHTELTRKACVDVLKLEVLPLARGKKVKEASEQVEAVAPVLETAEILEVLREIGREGEDGE